MKIGYAYQQSYPHYVKTNFHRAVELKHSLWHA